IRALAAPVAGLGGVERIFINLERRTPPASFLLYGPRLVPTFNYFQSALVLAADGWLDPVDIAAVATGLARRAGYTARRLENSLADLVRRGLVPAPTPHRLTAAVREAGLLPALPRGAWIARLRARLARRHVRAAPRPPQGPLDYEGLLARARSPRAGETPRAHAR